MQRAQRQVAIAIGTDATRPVEATQQRVEVGEGSPRRRRLRASLDDDRDRGRRSSPHLSQGGQQHSGFQFIPLVEDIRLPDYRSS